MLEEIKAQELIEKFRDPTKQWHEIKGYWEEDLENAKQCALVCVDEIIEQWEYIDTYLADKKGELNPNLKFWLKVKEEIKKQ